MKVPSQTRISRKHGRAHSRQLQIPVDANFRPDRWIVLNGRETGQVLLGAVSLDLVWPQVEPGRPKSPIPAADSVADQANNQVRVLVPPPSVLLVQAIDGQEVVPPERHVAALRSPPVVW